MDPQWPWTCSALGSSAAKGQSHAVVFDLVLETCKVANAYRCKNKSRDRPLDCWTSSWSIQQAALFWGDEVERSEASPVDSINHVSIVMSFFVFKEGFPVHICKCLALMTIFGFFCGLAVHDDMHSKAVTASVRVRD